MQVIIESKDKTTTFKDLDVNDYFAFQADISNGKNVVCLKIGPSCYTYLYEESMTDSYYIKKTDVEVRQLSITRINAVKV